MPLSKQQEHNIRELLDHYTPDHDFYFDSSFTVGSYAVTVDCTNKIPCTPFNKFLDSLDIMHWAHQGEDFEYAYFNSEEINKLVHKADELAKYRDKSTHNSLSSFELPKEIAHCIHDLVYGESDQCYTDITCLTETPVKPKWFKHNHEKQGCCMIL